MSGIDDWDELGPPEVRPVPEGRSGLVRAVVVAVLAVAGVLLIGFGAYAIVRNGAPARVATRPARPAETTQSGTVTESFTVTATVAATGTTVVTPTPTVTSSPATSVVQSDFVRAAKVAYRQNGSIYVADESGQNARPIVVSPSGAFALSPDGGTLAVVDVGKTLSLIDVAAGKVTTVGPADVLPPEWSPSSTWLAFTNSGEVRRVSRDGTGIRYLGAGTRVAIGPDDSSYAFLADGAIMLSKGGTTPRRLQLDRGADDIALGPDRVFYTTAGGRSALSVHSMALDGSADRQLIGAPSSPEAGRYGNLELSPNGVELLFSTSGDAEYSRLFIMGVDGSGLRSLSRRLDDYFVRWSADGTRLLYIDGNAWQRQPTQLMGVRLDGSERTVIVQSAGF